MLLHEFDPEKRAVFNPTDVVAPVVDMPKIAVSCFARETFSRMVERLGGVQIAQSSCANMVFPVYRVEYCGVPLALMMAGVGAPLCIGGFEELFAMGVETVVLFGTCGVLDRSIGDCSVIIPTSALRDEGTSFHYAPPSDEIEVNRKHRELFTALLDELGCAYTTGKTWTTDAIYRETREKMERRRTAGCVCVDMECSAMAALAQFREKDVFQFFYAADNLDAEQWDKRSLSNDDRLEDKDRVAQLALELAVRIGREVS